MNISSISRIETKNIQRINSVYVQQIKSVCEAEISMKPFKTLWSVGAGQSITLPLTNLNGSEFNFTVNWGDGTSSFINSYDNANKTHTYSNVGEYVVSIKGICQGWNFQSVNTSRLLITKVLDFGEVEFKSLSFYYCNNLNEISGQINGPTITNFSWCFSNNQLTSIPKNLFDFCTQVTDFSGCFYYNQLVSIPQNLFDSCTQVTNFSICFYYNQLTSIPEGLFDACTRVTDFSSCFSDNQLVSIPAGFFDNNISVTNFSYCFTDNIHLKLNKYIFYSEGQQSTRFLNKSVNFQSCFQRNSYISPDAENGEAPDLWNCSFGTGSPTTTSCFGGNGNNAITLTNYTSIPSDWK